jgi:hypothetical protein
MGRVDAEITARVQSSRTAGFTIWRSNSDDIVASVLASAGVRAFFEASDSDKRELRSERLADPTSADYTHPQKSRLIFGAGADDSLRHGTYKMQ